MQTAKFESNPRVARLLTLGALLLGALLAFKTHDFHAAGFSNQGAAFWLGCLLLFTGLIGLFQCGQETITINPKRREIVIEETRWILGPKRQAIGFDEIAHVGLGYSGRASNFVTCYFVRLTLHDGAGVSLFAPGRGYPGSTDRATVAAWRDGLQSCLGRG